jgi:putative pyrroloquinoline-quinone binding quinoprotein
LTTLARSIRLGADSSVYQSFCDSFLLEGGAVMRYSPFVVVGVAFLISTFSASAEFARELAWKADSEKGFSSPNELREGTTGESIGIVVCEVGRGVVCFGADGTRLWDVPMTPPVSACPAIADVDGDGREEIVACDGGGNIFLLSDRGEVIWKNTTRGTVRAESCPAIADLDEDGSPEILVGDISGAVNCFDRSGKRLWTFVGRGDKMGPVLVANIYNTPGREIIVTSHNGHIYALNSRGEWLWDIFHAKECLPESTPVLADVDGNGVHEIYIGGGLHHFIRIDPSRPEIVLDENVYLHVNNAILATDIDGDGKDEVVFGNKGGKVYCYDGTGFRWTREFRHTSMSVSPFALNLDQDPELEMIFSFMETQVLDTDGTILAEMSSPTCNGAPLAGDFDGDGKLDVVLTGHGLLARAGLQYYKWDVPYKEDPRQWVVYAGNRAHTGLVPAARENTLLSAPGRSISRERLASFAPVAELRLFTGGNTWRFDVQNPGKNRLTFLTEIHAPDGSIQRYANHIRTEKERTAFDFEVTEPGRYSVTQVLVDSDSLSVHASRKQTLEFQGAEGDADYLSRILGETRILVEAWGETNPRVSETFRNELLTLSGRLMALSQAKSEVPEETVQTQIAAVRRKAERIESLAKAWRTLSPEGTFAAWEFCPWAYFNPTETVPNKSDKTEGLKTTLCAQEHDSIAINVTSFVDQTLDIRIWAEDLKKVKGEETIPWGSHLEFRRAVMVPTLRRERVADALPILDQASILPVSSLETQQLWMTVDTSGLKPGEYTTAIHLKTVEPDPTEIILPLEIEVVDLELPSPSPLKFCVWAYSADAPDYEVENLVDHGVNVHFGISPTATCDENGEIIGGLRYEKHDASVERLSKHGILLFIGSQGSLRGQPFLSEPWKKAYIKYLRAWVQHLKRLGVGYDDFALYPYDEPSSPYSRTTLNLVEVAKVVREADPNILIYTDPSSGTTRKTLEMFDGLIDIWCPSSELLERFEDEIIPFAKRVGKHVWFYDASGRARTLSCLGIYRWRFWYAWNRGLTGAGWWTYKHGSFLWDGLTPDGSYYNHVYDAPGAIVTSKRWEASREAIEDYEVLYLLREAIRNAEARGVSTGQLANAKQVLSELPAEIEDALLSTGRRLPLTPDSVPLYDKVTETLRAARARIVETCLQVDNL